MKKFVYVTSHEYSVVNVFDSANKQIEAVHRFIENNDLTEEDISVTMIGKDCMKYSFKGMADSPFKVLYLERWEVE